MNNALYSSKYDSWETPKYLFDSLDSRYSFTLDACASKENAKCPNYFTKEDDCLTKDFCGHTVFMNPPYGRGIGKFVKKASEEAEKPNTMVVMLIPARTDTSWFHDYVLPKARDIRFLRGRLRFSGSDHDAPFPSMIVVFGGKE